MPPKPNVSKTSDNRRSVTVVQSKVNRRGSLEGAEETEIHAQVHVPEEGCWGWVVVAASFYAICMLDGVAYTFGSIRPDMSLDLGVPDTMVALINSIAVALYLTAGPLVSALINRFGFRACTMAGSVVCSLSIFISYFLTNYGGLCVFFGIFLGFGYALINMAASLVVGFYFEKMRSIAIAISTCGSSIGVTLWYPVNAYLVHLAGWRSVILLQSGLFGTIFFVAMAFRPLLELHVVKTQETEDPTRTVTYLPNVSAAADSTQAADTAKPTAAERLFAAVKNDNFPTAAAVVNQEDQPVLTSQAGPSAKSSGGPVSKLTITAIAPKSGISQRHLQQVKSMISKTSVMADTKQQKLQITIPEEPKKISCWGRLCHWEQHVAESRPMYRDDAFYEGKIERLPEYQKSKAAVDAEHETGLEYQLAVSRAAAAHDLQEHRGVFTTAVRRVLATMMDTKLLKLKTFQLLCTSGFLAYLGLLVPYAYTQERNLKAGINASHCSLFVSVLGGCNALGRLVLGSLAAKFSPVVICAAATFAAGIVTILSSLSMNMIYQFTYSGVYGFCIAAVPSLRSLVIVHLYGLENLTNGTGMILLFQGIGSLVSTPLAGVLKENFGYTVAYSVAGLFITLGGVIICPLTYLHAKEEASVARSPPRGSDSNKKKFEGSNKSRTSKK